MKKEIIDTLKSIIGDAKKQGHIIVRIEDLENAIPELKKESEDEKIRKEISDFLLTTTDLRLIGNIKRYDWISWLENWPKLEEINPKSKPEPKFHEGDWVVLFPSEIEDRKVVQISRVEECQLNMYWTTEGNWFGDGTDARLWTIEDAKNGDILAETERDVILIFKGIGNTEWNDVIDYHCYYDCYWEDFIVQEKLEHWGNTWDTQLKPATKEQRKLLFQKMGEAGYKWNSETKRLYCGKRKFKV